MKLQVIGTEVVAEAPRPLRLTMRQRPAQTSGNWVIDARRVMGLTMLRIAFGVTWAVDASLRWQPAFQANFQQILTGVAKG